MRAVRFQEFGDPATVLRLEDLPDPDLAPGDALVRMMARPINPSDLLTIQGRYGALPELPATPGWEGVGVVEEVAAGSDQSLVGKQVVPIGAQGTWQELIAVPTTNLVVVPNGVADDDAAQAFINPLSAWAMLDDLDIPAGQWLVQTAAASALGLLIVQLASLRAVRTINLVRRKEQVSDLKVLGANVVLVGEENLAERVLEVTGEDGVGFALDAVGGSLGAEVLRTLRPGGLMLVHGSLAHPEPMPVAMGRLLTRSLTVRGFWLNEWRSRTPIAEQADLMDLILQLLAGYQIRFASVEERLDLADFAEAIRLAAKPGRRGKILLESQIFS